MRTIFKKGYSLHITSWENDGDNHGETNTNFETLEEARKYKKLCEDLFTSRNSRNKGIGNSIEGDEFRVTENILDYLDENDFFEDQDSMTDEMKYEKIMSINTKLLGYSDFYISRVYENGSILYSPIDLKVEEIE